MNKDGLTRKSIYGLRFKKQSNSEELPGLIPCSAHSCFQNSIPTVQDKEDKKDLSLLSSRLKKTFFISNISLSNKLISTCTKHALHGGG